MDIPETSKYDPDLQEEINVYGEDNIGEDLSDEDVHELTSLIVDIFSAKS